MLLYIPQWQGAGQKFQISSGLAFLRAQLQDYPITTAAVSDQASGLKHEPCHFCGSGSKAFPHIIPAFSGDVTDGAQILNTKDLICANLRHLRTGLTFVRRNACKLMYSMGFF
jgi:hypothetical protein